MRLLLLVVLWCLLWVFAWPLALLILLISPVILVMAIPFGIIGLVLTGIFAFIEALIMAPAHMVGRRARC